MPIQQTPHIKQTISWSGSLQLPKVIHYLLPPFAHSHYSAHHSKHKAVLNHSHSRYVAGIALNPLHSTDAYLIKRRRNVGGDNLGHRESNPHHDQQLPVERRQRRRQCFAPVGEKIDYWIIKSESFYSSLNLRFNLPLRLLVVVDGFGESRRSPGGVQDRVQMVVMGMVEHGQVLGGGRGSWRRLPVDGGWRGLEWDWCGQGG